MVKSIPLPGCSQFLKCVSWQPLNPLKWSIDINLLVEKTWDLRTLTVILESLGAVDE